MTATLLPATALSVRGLHLALGGRELFADLDLDLPAGRWTCLLGPSGAGKTSLLRLIAGLVPGRPALVEGAAYMAQQDLLLPWLGVLDNLVLGYRLRNQPPPFDAARALLARMGLTEAAHLRPAELSGGMRQRAALARTLLEDRPVVLMDEPFSAVDAVTRLKLQTLAAEMLAGRTVLLVTHDPLEALRLGHRIHVLAGRPARLSEPLIPPGPPPRDAADPRVLALQAELLRRLEAA